MKTCPECGHNDSQYFHRTGSTPEAPAEPAHWECCYCGMSYGENDEWYDDTAEYAPTADLTG